MATSKMIAIKNTLKKAIDYIINPDKTENGQLVSSYSVPSARQPRKWILLQGREMAGAIELLTI